MAIDRWSICQVAIGITRRFAVRHEEISVLAEQIIIKNRMAPYNHTGLEEAPNQFVPIPKLGEVFRNYFRPGLYLANRCTGKDFSPHPVSLKEEEELFEFDCSARRQIRKEIKNFWETRHESLEEGIAHRMGIAIHGPPGSGKSMFLKQEIRQMVAEGQVVMLVDSPWYMKESIANFRAMESDRPLTVVIEDIDEITERYGEQIFLETMGGLESVNNVMFIATTNHLNELSEKLRRRGRFDRKIELVLPSEDLRRSYLESKVRGREPKRRIAKIASITEGFSFGDLRDLHRSVYVYGQPVREVLIGIKSEIHENVNARSKKSKSQMFGEELCSSEKDF